MRAWFEEFEQREQVALLLLVGAVLLFLLYRLAYLPLTGARDAVAQENARLQFVLSDVSGIASRINAAQKNQRTGNARKNITRIINQSTTRMQLPVSRLQPNSRGDVQVRLENVALEKVVKWLYFLEHDQQLVLSDVSLSQGSSAGVVSASVRVAEGE
ncbi:MAG: general secretion pathway protein GspM [Gammaproteobacteria bacterium]|nr:MAG: general secretion pathway protein GspM [Gammaproteobacteria bacterium]